MPRATAHEILERFYEAERIYMSAPPDKADFSGMQATLSPDIKLYQTSALPYGGTYEGYAGFLKWSKSMATWFDKIDPQPSNVLENGDDVVILMTVNVRVKATGEEMSDSVCATCQG